MDEVEKHIDVCVQGTNENVGPPITVWAGFHYGGKIELIELDRTMS